MCYKVYFFFTWNIMMTCKIYKKKKEKKPTTILQVIKYFTTLERILFHLKYFQKRKDTCQVLFSFISIAFLIIHTVSKQCYWNLCLKTSSEQVKGYRIKEKLPRWLGLRRRNLGRN